MAKSASDARKEIMSVANVCRSMPKDVSKHSAKGTNDSRDDELYMPELLGQTIGWYPYEIIKCW